VVLGFAVFWYYGLAGSPGALLSPGVLVGRVLDFEQCRSVWLSANISFSFALTQKKQKVKAVHRS
jgi:hypothetical protein